MRFCPNCGSKNADDAEFCISCGNPLAARNTKNMNNQFSNNSAGNESAMKKLIFRILRINHSGSCKPLKL